MVRWVVELVLGNTFNNVENIANFAHPLLVTMSTGDDVIPFEQATQVYEAATAVPAGQKSFVKYDCVPHQADLTPKEKAALTTFL